MKHPLPARSTSALLGALVTAALVAGGGTTRSGAPERRPTKADPLAPWAAGVHISLVSPAKRHAIHTYYGTSPESPDGRWVLFYASTTAEGYEGEIRIRERATGKETGLARDVVCEDAHRAACQQWVSGGRRVVYHNVLKSGEWVVMCVDVETGRERLLAKGRQLGFGQAAHDVVPLYGPHWKPGKYRGLELLNVQTGKIDSTALTAEAVQKAFPDWVKKQFGDKPISVFAPMLSPDLRRVFFKVASPAGGDFRSRSASHRFGLLVYDLEKSALHPRLYKWGHPGWHPNSRTILEVAGKVIDTETGKDRRIPNYPRLRGEHPSYSPDGSLFTADAVADGAPFFGPRGSWAVVVGDAATGNYVKFHQFDNSKGARSWRRCHPHPAFSLDGKRIYFNASDGEWTRLHVAEVAP
jgi:hypothetical protein